MPAGINRSHSGRPAGAPASCERWTDQVWIRKLGEYAAFGVRWYWIVDPEAKSLEILRLGEDGRYVHAVDAEEGVVDVPGCEGLRLDLTAVWRGLDQRSEQEES